MEKEHILVVDDEEGLLHLVKMRLTAMGFAVTGCTTGREALAVAKNNRFDLAITDLRLGNEDGLDVTEELLRIIQAFRYHPDRSREYSQCRGSDAAWSVRISHEALR